MPIIYTTNTCAYCKMVKNFLTGKGVKYEEVNLDDNPERQQESIALAGVMTVPVTKIKDQVIVGWNPGQLMRALA